MYHLIIKDNLVPYLPTHPRTHESLLPLWQSPQKDNLRDWNGDSRSVQPLLPYISSLLPACLDPMAQKPVPIAPWGASPQGWLREGEAPATSTSRLSDSSL